MPFSGSTISLQNFDTVKPVAQNKNKFNINSVKGAGINKLNKKTKSLSSSNRKFLNSLGFKVLI